MVLGLIALAATVPMTATSVLGLQEKAESTKEKGPQAEWKSDKCRMRCRATDRTPADRKDLFSNSQVVVRDGKLCVQLSTHEGKPNHPFTGYYLPYPDSNFDGLVSTISKDPPQLNWIYLHKESWQICCGLRVDADKELPGPWVRKFAQMAKNVSSWRTGKGSSLLRLRSQVSGTFTSTDATMA